MFSGHLIIEVNNEKVLYLFIDYNYEFADLLYKGKKEKSKTIYQKVINYIKDKKIDFDGTKVFLVVNGLIIGTLILTYYSYQDQSLEAKVTPKYQYVEYIKDFKKTKINIEEKKEIKGEQKKTNDKITTTTPKKEITNIPKTKSPTKPKTENSSSKNKKESPVNKVTKNEIEVILYRYNGTIEKINLEDYVIGVVGAEMPASFHSEALKAQAVAARTYALKRVKEGKVLTDNNSHQMYKDVNQLKTYWGGNFNTYYNKIKKAVNDTKGEYISYNNYYIDAVYHSTSNGKTENSIDVWGNEFPYLVSVDSHWDKNAPSYLRNTTINLEVVNKTLNLNLNENSNIEVLERTKGDNIKTIKIDEKIFTGKYIRETLGLRSTDFDIKIENNNVIFTTRGYGHGVGMSQYGALGMAKQGYNYKQILTHYYKSTSIRK